MARTIRSPGPGVKHESPVDCPAMPPSLPASRRLAALFGVGLVTAGVVVACGTPASSSGPIVPGTSGNPRAVALVARDYTYVPATLDVVPGETVILQVINGGLVVHEAVIGPMTVQDAWEAAEAPTSSAPPGPTIAVSVPPGLEGLRIVLTSGERKDVPWNVPPAPTDDAAWFVGCHIPGHWAQGMVIPIRFVGPDGQPLGTPAGAAGDTLRTAPREGWSAASR